MKLVVNSPDCVGRMHQLLVEWVNSPNHLWMGVSISGGTPTIPTLLIRQSTSYDDWEGQYPLVAWMENPNYL